MGEKISNNILPISIVLASLILGGFYYANQVNKQLSIEREEQVTEEKKQKCLDNIYKDYRDKIILNGTTDEDGLVFNDVKTLERLEKDRQFNVETCIKLYK